MSEAILDSDGHNALATLQIKLEGGLKALDVRLLDRHRTISHIELFDNHDVGHGYEAIPPEVAADFAKISQEHGARGAELYNQLLLVTILKQVDVRRQRYALPQSVIELLRIDVRRVITELQAPRAGFYSYQHEPFIKDLGLCRLRLIPCGSEYVSVLSGVPRRLLFNDGVGQFAACIGFFMRRVGGFKPLYESHWDRRLAAQFNEQAYEACYVRIAEMLAMNMHMKGVFGASWWFDPAARRISPELEFLSHLPKSNGAMIFRVGPHPHATRDAISFSARRKALYNSGEYRPERYMLIWPRDALLAWARKRAV